MNFSIRALAHSSMRLIAAASWLVWVAASPVAASAESAAATIEIPAPVSAALHEARIPSSAVAIVVAPLGDGTLTLTLNEAAPMNPASTMKLLTTYAALNMLGPTFQWRTGVYATSRPHAGRLEGDLILRGSGDPSLVIERFWM